MSDLGMGIWASGVGVDKSSVGTADTTAACVTLAMGLGRTWVAGGEAFGAAQAVSRRISPRVVSLACAVFFFAAIFRRGRGSARSRGQSGKREIHG